MIGLQTKTANANHFKKVFENSYFTMFTLATNELQELIDGKDYFSRCTSLLKQFDRIQIVKEDEKVVFEYIVMDVDALHNKVVVQKLHKIDLLNGKQTLFGYDFSTKKVEEELKNLRVLIEGALTQKFNELDKCLDEKIDLKLKPYFEEEEG